MQSVAVNNENRDKLLKNERPNLSINTQLPRKKKSWHLFSSREKTKFDQQNNSKPHSFTPKLLKRTSLPLPSSQSDPSVLHHQSTSKNLRPIRNTIVPMFSNTNYEKSIDEDDKQHRSMDSSSVHSNGSVHHTLKKFHLPHLHKRIHSQHKSVVSDDRLYTPTVPVPIIPPMVDWSSQEPISPPPWELSSNDEDEGNRQHHFVFHHANHVEKQAEADIDVATTGYHSDTELDRISSANISPTGTTSHSLDDVALTTSSSLTAVSTHSTYDDQGSTAHLKRRSSCPTYDTMSLNSSSSSKTLVENDIIAITEQHTRYMSVLKKYTHPVNKKPVFKSCQKVKARAAEAAANGESLHVSNSIYSSFCEENLKYLYIPNVFDPATREHVLEFSAIKPRKYQLHRKTNWKREAKALLSWHHMLEDKIHKHAPVYYLPKEMPSDKVERYALTRRFILREFFTTEVNFWNQLYYTKIVFYDALIYSLEKGSPFTKPADVDIFANLFDLMQFSAKLINHLRHFQLGRTKVIPSISADDKSHKDSESLNCDNVHLGKVLSNMSEGLVVFLRCALDYKENRKHLDTSEHNEGFAVFNKKLNSRKETSQFSMKDFLIIPIQRVARYGLLITDLLKHTGSDHPDYRNLTRSHQIVTSLASAMNSVQKKHRN